MMNFFNLTLSEKHFIFPSTLNDSFAGYSNLGCSRNGDHVEGYQQGSGRGREGGKVQRISSINGR